MTNDGAVGELPGRALSAVTHAALTQEGHLTGRIDRYPVAPAWTRRRTARRTRRNGVGGALAPRFGGRVPIGAVDAAPELPTGEVVRYSAINRSGRSPRSRLDTGSVRNFSITSWTVVLDK